MMQAKKESLVGRNHFWPETEMPRQVSVSTAFLREASHVLAEVNNHTRPELEV